MPTPREVEDVLLTSEGRRIYPFTPALLQALVAGWGLEGNTTYLPNYQVFARVSE